ncbi:MAG: DUF1569 domain-containing protein [Bacteroidetes bacterium]|nr:DUF1569 domain-containing protein [Bacteroidota bacterium]
MIQIDKIDETINTISKLNADTQPVFGGMTPQQMVEHLVTTIKMTNGKRHIEQRTTKEEGEKWKQGMIYSDMDFPMGLKTPLIPDGPVVYNYADIHAAIDVLRTELQDLETYFKNNPDATPTHPRLGVLNHKEWLIFHAKHFTHHYKQFGLL